MTFSKKLLLVSPVLLLPVVLMGQGRGLDPAQLLKPLSDSWPTYNGDYSGKRYSLLTQINQTTVKNLTLAWTVRLTGATLNAGGGRGGFGGGGANLIVGGEGTGD